MHFPKNGTRESSAIISPNALHLPRHAIEKFWNENLAIFDLIFWGKIHPQVSRNERKWARAFVEPFYLHRLSRSRSFNKNCAFVFMNANAERETQRAFMPSMNKLKIINSDQIKY